MLEGKDYAPCPYCAANNITHRKECWRCGSALPYTLGIDGKPRVNTDAMQRSVSRSEIDRLLSQAQTLDLEEERRKDLERKEAERAEQNASIASRAWLWLNRLRRENPSES